MSDARAELERLEPALGLLQALELVQGPPLTVSEQARADAQADAETLREFMRHGRHFCGVPYAPGWELSFMDYGWGTRKAIAWRRPGQAGRRAVVCARAAFKACPGLRPEVRVLTGGRP